MRNSTKIWLIAVSALLTAVAFPPYKLGFLVYFSPILLLIVIDRLPARQAFAFGYLWGIIFNLGTLYGVFWATVGGTFGMLAAISLIPALNVLAYKFVSNKSRILGYVIWPLIWVAWDYLRTLTQFNFPWNDYGYTQASYLPIIQAAEIFGVYGVSLMIHVVNILLYSIIVSDLKNKSRLALLSIAAFLPVAFMIYGYIRIPAQTEPGDLDIALIQGNITRDIKWSSGGRAISFATYMNMTREAYQKGVDLVIWPETALPYYLLHKQNHLQRVQNLVDSSTVSLLTGIPHYISVGLGEYVYFNASALITPEADSVPHYEKVKLVPMSERIPFSGRFKVLKEIRLGQADFSSGRYATIFDLDSTKFATVICFESAFPGYCADFCRKGAEFLVVITNDMWFGPSSLPYSHAAMSAFRAVENRVPLARCANTGISMFFDKYGRIFGNTDTYERTISYGAIMPEKSTSVYNKLGDILPEGCALASIIIILAVAFLKRGKYNEIYEN